MKLALRRLGTPQAISWFSFAFLVVLQGSGSVVSSLAPYDGRLLEFLGIRLGAFVPLGLVLAAGRFALNRVTASSIQPFLTVTILFLAISAGTATFDALLVVAEFTEDYVFLRRLLTSLPGALTGSVLISLLVVSAREQSLANARLLSSANRLITMRGDIERRISERRKELVHDIRRQVEAQFQRLGSKDSADTSVLRDLIDDVVRPLSYSLVKRSRSVSTPGFASGDVKVAWGTVVSSSVYSNPFHWRIQPLILGAIGATFLVLNFGLNGLLATVGLMLASGLIVALARLSWPSLPPGLPVSFRIALVALISSAIAYLGAWVAVLTTGFSLLDPVKFVAWWIIVTVAVVAATLVVEVFRMLRTTEEKLSATLKELRKEVTTLNTSLRQLHKAISRILHGPVQEAVYSVMIELEHHPERSDSVEALATLRSRIITALSRLDSPSIDESDPKQVVDHLRELWEDTVDISLDATTDDLGLIRDRQQTAYAVSEVVREACQNGLRHGQATAIAIEIRVMPDKRKVEVSVYNTGIPVQTDVRRGLGSQLFDDLSLQWERHPEPDGTRFKALLPLINDS
jgi:two-component sensor histidine kinase